MPEIPEELDVFRLPHGHMKQLVKDMDKEVRVVCTFICVRICTRRKHYVSVTVYVLLVV